MSYKENQEPAESSTRPQYPGQDAEWLLDEFLEERDQRRFNWLRAELLERADQQATATLMASATSYPI